MADTPHCWKCGASLAQLSLPLLRQDACRQCNAELHVCKLCRFYDISIADQCREPIAAQVRDKERANYCDYFSINSNAYKPAAVSASRDVLDELFGGSGAAASTVNSAEAARIALEQLFKK